MLDLTAWQRKRGFVPALRVDHRLTAATGRGHATVIVAHLLVTAPIPKGAVEVAEGAGVPLNAEMNMGRTVTSRQVAT